MFTFPLLFSSFLLPSFLSCALLCGPSCPQILGCLASVSQVLGLQTFITVPGFDKCFLNKCFWGHTLRTWYICCWFTQCVSAYQELWEVLPWRTFSCLVDSQTCYFVCCSSSGCLTIKLSHNSLIFHNVTFLG